jgi:hypothetical protein
MARHLTRALGGIALAGACLALGACSSSGPASSGGSAPSPVKTGTVTVKEGNKVICVMTVANGKGTCKVPASNFGAGTNAIVGYYSGKGYRSSQSQPTSVTVTKAP